MPDDMVDHLNLRLVTREIIDSAIFELVDVFNISRSSGYRSTQMYDL